MSILNGYELGLATASKGWKRAIALKYGIDPTQLNKWKITRLTLSRLEQQQDIVQLRQNLKTMDISRATLKPGKDVRYPYIESWLYNKFDEYRDRHLPVSTKLLTVVVLSRFPLIFHEGDQTNWYKR